MALSSQTTPTPPLLRADGTLSPAWLFLAAHRALRRDAARFENTARAWSDHAEQPALDARRSHRRNYTALLRIHHETEDATLFPTLRSLDPDLAPLLDQLDAQHLALDAVVDRITHLPAAPTAPGTARATAVAFTDLRSLLEPHLEAEEEHLVPVVLTRLMPPDESSATDNDDAAGSDPGIDFGPVPTGFGLPWLTDGLTDSEHTAVTAAL